MNWFIFALKNFGDFKGRARRSEFWFFQLFVFAITAVLVFIDSAMGTLQKESSVGLLSGIFSLVILIPSISVSVRRLHDTGRSGWYLLLSFVPLVNFALLFFFAGVGKYGPNQWGLDPKQGSS
jgi:uncharacterized membrane protein YhaH (DUF805 family)